MKFFTAIFLVAIAMAPALATESNDIDVIKQPAQKQLTAEVPSEPVRFHSGNIADTEQPLTLKMVIENTLKQNPQLHQFSFTRERLMAEREIVSLKPEYRLDLELENFGGSGETSGLDNAEITVALSSIIELGSKRESRISVLNARVGQLEIEQQIQTLDVLGNVTSAFIQLLTSQEELKLFTESVHLSEEIFNTVQKRAKHGAVSDAEVMRAKAMATRSQIKLENARLKFERQKVSLARYWNETTPTFSVLEGKLFVFGQSVGFDELYEKVKKSPAITVFASETRLKDTEIRLAQTQNKFDLNWQFGVKRLEESDDTALVVGFSMPLFSERRNRSNVNAALAERNSVAYQRTDRLLVLHDHLYRAYSLHKQFIATHQRLKKQVIPDLEKALIITRESYERGRLKYQDWIAAQQELLSAKQQLIGTASAALLNQTLIEQLIAEPLTK